MTAPSANFAFLGVHDPLLVRLAGQAERYFADDPNTSLLKVRQFGEALAQQAAALSGVYTSVDDRQMDVLNALRSDGVLPARVSELFHSLRRIGNRAVHEFEGSHREALHQLKMARRLAIWFHSTFGTDPTFKPGPFVPPPDPAKPDAALHQQLEELRAEMAGLRSHAEQVTQSAQVAANERAKQVALRAEAEATATRLYQEVETALALAEETEAAATAERARFQTKLAEQQKVAASAPAEVAIARRHAATVHGNNIQWNEAETRRIIDIQLRETGWDADSDTLTYAKGVRPAKGQNRAIAEWPTKTGPADYVLFIGTMPVAVVEAKRSAKSVSTVVKQAKRYGRGFILPSDQTSPGGPWGKDQIPFLFATNGRAFHRQLIDESGIWFLDARQQSNLPRALEDWYTPEGLAKLLEQDIPEADAALATASIDYLPLWDFQKTAVRAVETGIAEGKREILLAMATGTGKTRTAIGLLYRLIKAKRFRRVLFLVDRTSLGQQASDSFATLKLEQNQSFTDIYDVKALGDITPESDTRLQISTVQGLVRRVLYSDESLPVDQYDCIVVDECHRGYNLDREMSDQEMTFRSELDYISTYRRVLDHFDAVKVGLTATPAKHTTDIFGEPVFTYSYRQAVIDDKLVDHEPPYRIVTELNKNGMKWVAGDTMKLYRTRTGDTVSATTPDEVHIEVESFNKKVITESFNQTVCAALAQEIDPSLPGKTLIFCATDRHADMVVRLLNEEFAKEYGAVDNDAVTKITGAADKPNQQIRNFKNEALPSVVVTVDLLTTGIDVPAIVNLVFLRRVRSRILYEQMLGRATRLCPTIGKRYFRIYDAVDLYAALLPHSSMKPVVVNPQFTFKKLTEELVSQTDETARSTVRDELVAKMLRKIRALSIVQLSEFTERAGKTAHQVIDDLRTPDLDECVAWWESHGPMAKWLDDARTGDGPVQIISSHQDKLIGVERGFKDGQAPKDYLESFGEYVRAHINDMPVLKLIAQRPRDLTRADLRALKLALDEAGYTEAGLSFAWSKTTNQDIAATIIGFIRREALGSPLIPYEDRVKAALNRILASRSWKPNQRRWLERIGKQLAIEKVLDRKALDSGSFKTQGGFKRLNKVFDGELERVLAEISDAVWEDVG